jgi:hypothetical protein
MAIMTKQQAKKLIEQPDKMLDVLNLLEDKKIINVEEHRATLLKGYSKLVAVLQEKKVINAKDAKAAMQGGFASLLETISA